MDNLSQQLAELAEYWNQIEKRIKQAEQLRDKAVIPAINELRYAGRKFIDAWALSTKENRTEDDDRRALECITVARQYLTNADHDTIDAALSFIYRNMSYVTKRYEARKIAPHVPGFLEILDEMDENKNKIAKSRIDRNERTSIYNGLLPHFEKMIEAHRKVDRAERHILRRQKRGKFWFDFFAIVGVIGALASIIALVVIWAQVKTFFGF
jgi:hypothetical protein